MSRTQEHYVLQHRDRGDTHWIDHQTQVHRSELLAEMYHLSDSGTVSKEYRVIRRTETELLRFNGLRNLLED